MKTIFETSAVATGGRNGTVKSDDNILNLEVRVPREMGGSGGNYTNPEQLFAAGYAACFDSALNHMARQTKIKVGVTKVRVKIGLALTETKEFGLVAALEAEIPGVDREQAQILLEKAHATCPYSRAIAGNVEVTLSLI